MWQNILFFLKRLNKAIRSPTKAFYWAYLNLRPNMTKLSPLTVTFSDARRFFYHESEQTDKLVKLIQPLLKKTDTVFDIGSNCGYLSKEIFDSGYKGGIVLFEPIPNLMSISINLLSEYVNKKIFVNCALGDENGEIDLVIPKNGNIGWITAVREKADSENIFKVRQEDTRNFIEIFRPEFCKIDVEGYEFFILKCFFEKINNQYKPSFLIELGWGSSNPNWNKLVDLASNFLDKGYSLYYAEESVVEINIESLKEFDRTIDVVLCPRGFLGL